MQVTRTQIYVNCFDTFVEQVRPETGCAVPGDVQREIKLNSRQTRGIASHYRDGQAAGEINVKYSILFSIYTESI